MSACFWRNFRASSLFENFAGSSVSGLMSFVLGCLLGGSSLVCLVSVVLSSLGGLPFC